MTASSFRISPAALLDLAFSLGRPIEERFGASLAGCNDAAQAQF